MASRLNPPRGGFSMESLRFPLAALGIFGLLAGLGAWLVQSDFGLVPRILIAAGVLLLGIYVALDPEDVWSKLTGRGALYSGNTVAIAVAAIFILGLLNVLGSRYQTKVDLTANKQFTLSDQSYQLAQALPQPVHVTGWLTANDSRKQDFQTLLTDYAAHSGGKLTFEFNDPEAHPADAVAAGITSTGTIVYQMGDKKQTSTGTTEKDVDTALVKLTRPQKTLYFTTGHGERSLDSTGPQDYGTIKQNLTTDNFTITPLNLVTQRAVPDDAAAVVVAGPTNPLLQEELDALKAYVDGGGKLIVLMGPNSKADLSSILQNYQVAFSGNVVIDPAKSVPQDPRVVVVDSYAQHAITQDLRDLTFFPLTTNITYPSTPPAGMTITALAQSSSSSWGNTNPQQIQQQPSDPKGPLALAVAIDAGASQGSSTLPGATPTPTPNAARIVLFGSPDLISDNSLQQVPGNGTLFENAANWVASEDNLINVRVPDTTPRTVVLTSSQMNLVAYSSFLFLPLAVLAAGAAVWWTRR
ncbi:MAG: GldG family protein [Chloroflexi bacterium]|nr:GldG family protein [Chloroflexota bacterium]